MATVTIEVGVDFFSCFVSIHLKRIVFVVIHHFVDGWRRIRLGASARDCAFLPSRADTKYREQFPILSV